MDMYAVRAAQIGARTEVEIVVVQCTANDKHADSYASFCTAKQSFLRGHTMLGYVKEKAALKYNVHPDDVRVVFIWGTAGQELDLTHTEQGGSNEPKTYKMKFGNRYRARGKEDPTYETVRRVQRMGK